jgi:hypothetical protein
MELLPPSRPNSNPTANFAGGQPGPHDSPASHTPGRPQQNA